MKIEIKDGITVEQFNTLRAAVGWATLEDVQAQTGINNSISFVAYYENQAVGMARIITDGGYVIFIADVIVLPEYQGKGIGRQLMEKVMGYIGEQKKDGYKFMVSLGSATGKEGFYEKFGFRQRPNDRSGAGMSIWME